MAARCEQPPSAVNAIDKISSALKWVSCTDLPFLSGRFHHVADSIAGVHIRNGVARGDVSRIAGATRKVEGLKHLAIRGGHQAPVPLVGIVPVLNEQRLPVG